MSSAGRSAIHFAKYLLSLDRPETQTTASEQAALSRHATDRGRLIEIGVYEGFTTRLLAEAMAAEGELYAIDPFLSGRLGICWGKWIARRETASISQPKKVHFIQQFSHDAARTLQGAFDFVFVDGDHSLDGIMRDWNDWSPRICRGGLIALHDSIPPTHNPAVAELGSCAYFDSTIRHAPEFETIDQVDSLSVLRRCE